MGFSWRLPSFSINSVARKVEMGLIDHFPFTKIKKNKKELTCELFLYYIYFSIIEEICNNH